MTELSNLHIKITGDSSDAILASAKLKNAMSGIDGSVNKLRRNIQQLGPGVTLASRQAVKGFTDFNKSARTARFHSANLFAQFQDIGVMMASGQSPFILAAQQGSQISQVMQTMGGTGRQQFGALAMAARQFISPMNLLVVGVVAGVAALGQWGIAALAARDKTSGLDDAMKSLRENVEDLELGLVKAANAFDSVDQARLFTEINKNVAEQLRLMAELDSLREKSAGIELDSLNIYIDQIRALEDQLTTLQTQETSARELLKQSIDLRTETELTKAVLEDLVEDADLFAAAFGKAAADANTLTKLLDSAVIAKEKLMAGTVGPDAARSQLYDEGRIGGELVGVLGTTTTPDRNTSTARRGPADHTEEDLDRLRESLMTELELEMKHYDERQKFIEDALRTEHLTKDEYRSLEQQLAQEHANKIRDIELAIQQQRLSNLSGMFGDFASLMNTNSRKLFEIGKTAGIAAAIIDTYSAINKALATHPPPISYAYAAASAAKGFASVAAIKSQTFSRGGGGGGSGGTSIPNAGSIEAGPAAATGGRPSVSLTLIGEQGFTRAQIVQIAEALNDSGDEGQELVQIRGRK